MKQASSPNPYHSLVELSEAWVSGWMQPWSAWQQWSNVWSAGWQHWVDAFAALPAPWLPALAEDRRQQVEALDAFLPWMPRADLRVTHYAFPGVEDAMGLMLRAAVPAAGLFGVAAFGKAEPRATSAIEAEVVSTEKRAAALLVTEPEVPAKPAAKPRAAKRPAARKAAATPAVEPAVEAPAVQLPLAEAAPAAPAKRRAAPRKKTVVAPAVDGAQAAVEPPVGGGEAQ